MSARACERECRGADLVGSRLGWMVWGLPGALVAVGIAWGAARAWLWIPSLAVAGSACLANASRCGRLHCFVTGPLFLAGALATLLDSASVLAIDWRWILAAMIAGTAAGYGLEWIRGEYLGTQPAGEASSS